MKSAEEFLDTFKKLNSDFSKKRRPLTELEMNNHANRIRNLFIEIQLDAMREGMRRASDKLSEACYEGTVVLSEGKQAILSAAEQLTEKDL